MAEIVEAAERETRTFALACLFIGICWVFFYSNPEPTAYYDYQFRAAESLLEGRLGLNAPPPTWLNEFVPSESGDRWYTVFPLGSVLTFVPFAELKRLGLIEEMPASVLAALTAAFCGFFLFRIAEEYECDTARCILMPASMLLGTFVWANLVLAGAWQLALGFAMLGELGAIYFGVFRRRPFLSGLFFAFAFGNRTEVLLAAPVLMFFAARGAGTTAGVVRRLAAFSAAPFVLGVLTLAYNAARFGSVADFGHARIPGVLEEPWYRYGIFSLNYVGANFYEMLVRPWNLTDAFPYVSPSGFGSAILWSSPFLLLVFRPGVRDAFVKYGALAAVVAMTILIWCHGNAGGWQFGYRYATVLLPWIYLILLENGPRRAPWYEWTLIGFSVAVNAYATYLFSFTDSVKP